MKYQIDTYYYVRRYPKNIVYVVDVDADKYVCVWIFGVNSTTNETSFVCDAEYSYYSVEEIDKADIWIEL